MSGASQHGFNRFRRMMSHGLVYVQVYGYNLFSAVAGAFVWSVVWFGAFYAANVVTLFMALGTVEAPTSGDVFAMGVTVSVIAGHAARMAAFVIGCDTDFRTMFDPRPVWRPRLERLCVGAAMFFLAVAFVISHEDGKGMERVDFWSSEFVLLSFEFWSTILCLFVAQCAFSWPDPKRETHLLEGLSRS